MLWSVTSRACEPAASPPQYPDLSLEQYASFSAERDLGRTEPGELRRKYVLADEAAHRGLEEHWRRRLQADGAAGQRFEGLVASYRAWLEQHG